MLSAAVIAVVGMMIVPLPAVLLDLLLTLNISAAAVLLIVTLYIPNITALSSLPSLLLLTTLLRLALNVSTTRLILLDAHAGRVIDAFGAFVVQGSVVVGAVVFLILTLIQFVVVARGAERVAEVAARFSLDAMPGRQMAIDADLRAGALSVDAARAARAALQRESQLYGALAGAMKFVKGDAVAGLVIIVVNISAGLAIGVLQRGMSLAEAASTYALLTIGDGLVSQIPALLTATAAGIAVTRVAAEGSPHLAHQIADQLLARPRALAIAAALLVVLALVPGLPLLPFLAVAGLLSGLAFFARREARAARFAEASAAAPSSPSIPAPLSLRVGSGAAAGFGESGLERLGVLWSERAEAIWRRTGVMVPRRLVSVVEGVGDEIVVLLDEIPAWRGEVSEGVEGAVEVLGACVEANLEGFVGLQEVQRMLDGLREEVPADVEAVVPRLLTLSELSVVLRGLVQEGVPVRQLRAILGALAQHAPRTKAPEALIEVAREALKRAITHAAAPEGGRLEVFLVDREIEEMVRSSVREGPRGPYLSLSPELSRQIEAAAGPLGPGSVVLTAPDVRRHLRAILARRQPSVRVLSHAELSEGLLLEPQGKLTVRGQSS